MPKAVLYICKLLSYLEGHITKQSSEFTKTLPAVTVLRTRICKNPHSYWSESQNYQNRVTHRGNKQVNGLSVCW